MQNGKWVFNGMKAGHNFGVLDQRPPEVPSSLNYSLSLHLESCLCSLYTRYTALTLFLLSSHLVNANYSYFPDCPPRGLSSLWLSGQRASTHASILFWWDDQSSLRHPSRVLAPWIHQADSFSMDQQGIYGPHILALIFKDFHLIKGILIPSSLHGK